MWILVAGNGLVLRESGSPPNPILTGAHVFNAVSGQYW